MLGAPWPMQRTTPCPGRSADGREDQTASASGAARSTKSHVRCPVLRIQCGGRVVQCAIADELSFHSRRCFEEPFNIQLGWHGGSQECKPRRCKRKWDDVIIADRLNSYANHASTRSLAAAATRVRNRVTGRGGREHLFCKCVFCCCGASCLPKLHV